MSGTCANTALPGPAAAPHAVLWEKDGTVRDLGNLGGTVNPQVLAVGNVALMINHGGQVAGASALPEIKSTECPGDPPNPKCFPFHPFLWTREAGMQDLGVLPGDFVGAGLGLNNQGEVVGPSFAAPGPTSATPRAFLWANGKMHDLNALLPPDSPLYLLIAYAINDSGEIAGLGCVPDTCNTSAPTLHAFLATPCDRTHRDTDWCKHDGNGRAAEADRTIARARILSQTAREAPQHVLHPGRSGSQLREPH